MGSGARVSGDVGGALASREIVDGRSEGVRGRERPTEARVSASGTVNVWDRSGKPFISGSSGVWDYRSGRDGKPLDLVILRQNGRHCRGQKLGAGW